MFYFFHLLVQPRLLSVWGIGWLLAVRQEHSGRNPEIKFPSSFYLLIPEQVELLVAVETQHQSGLGVRGAGLIIWCLVNYLFTIYHNFQPDLHILQNSSCCYFLITLWFGRFAEWGIFFLRDKDDTFVSVWCPDLKKRWTKHCIVIPFGLTVRFVASLTVSILKKINLYYI